MCECQSVLRIIEGVQRLPGEFVSLKVRHGGSPVEFEE